MSGTRLRTQTLLGVVMLGIAACGNNGGGARSSDGGQGGAGQSDAGGAGAGPAVQLRVASFNASLFREQAGELVAELAAESPQARGVAEVVQRIRPDILFVGEFDYDSSGQALKLFQERFLGVGQNGLEPITFAYSYAPPSNTGVHSGFDLDQSGAAVDQPGSREYGGDAFGFGQFEGQYGMAVLSRYPIDQPGVRTFARLLWSDVPEALIPPGYYTGPALEVFRLSSKSHIDVPIDVNGHLVHILGSHPTPPSFDGPEDRNGRRNHDEVRFWSDYLDGAEYIRDDQGVGERLPEDAICVVVGDLNSDPNDGGARQDAIRSLLRHPRLQDAEPESEGAIQQSTVGANSRHVGRPALDTADFNDSSVGNLRVDYVLPSRNVSVMSAGVFWPGPDEPDASLAGVSDHHLVWVDLKL